MKHFADDKTLLDFALQTKGQARLAMRGTSMLPLLREPYVLEIRKPERSVRKGDIVLFQMDRRLVAHRVVTAGKRELVCAGDANPDRTERIARSDVVGIVNRVKATQEPDAQRIDDLRFKLRGWLYARTRRLRAWSRDALPQLRPRTYATLVGVIGSVVRNDPSELRTLLRSTQIQRLAAMAERHRCGALLHAALRRFPDDEMASALVQLLGTSRWSTALRTAKLREQLRSVVRVLNDAGVTPILLKGAARLWSDDAESGLHDSVDLDLMVDGAKLARAREALQREGYRERTDGLHRAFYERHHHAPPLYPPEEGVSVELHHALAPPGSITLDTSVGALKAFLLSADHGGLRALRLDDAGAALHLVVHGYQRFALRDAYLLARLLARMPDASRRRLQKLLATEGRHPVAMQAMVALAASLASIPWPHDGAIARFGAWCISREDLPRLLRSRPECFDAWRETEYANLPARLRAVWSAAELDYPDTRRLAALRRMSRRWVMLATAAVTAAFVPMMRRP